MDELGDILLLRSYNTRLVILGTTLLGIVCGLTGTYLLLRKRSLMGSTLSHAMLPGICIAHMVAMAVGIQEKSSPALLAGAALAGILGCLAVLLIRNLTRLKDDAVMGIVLSGTFGLGIVLLSVIQHMPGGSADGLDDFIYGKTASMVMKDFRIITMVTLVSLLASLLLFKEFRLLCFDASFAASTGWPVVLLDTLMLGLVTLATVAGLQAVGLILVIAFLITPAAAARFWTDRLSTLLLTSALIGGISGWLGAVASALFDNFPAGAVIVLASSLLFLSSLLLGTRRGLLVRHFRQSGLKRRMERQHLLRAAFEWLEARGRSGGPDTSIPIPDLLASRSWSPRTLHRQIGRALRQNLILPPRQEKLRFTEKGFREAAQVTRNHRLWELYLIHHADIAPSHVDRDADAVEHVLGEELTRQLESMLAPGTSLPDMPRSPHPLKGGSHGMGNV